MPENLQPVQRLQYHKAVAIDISSTNHTLATPACALYVGGTGDVILDMGDVGGQITFKAVPVGTVLPICFNKIYKVGTGATYMLALS